MSTKTSVDDELRLVKIQLRRAVKAADEFPNDAEIEDIIDDLIGRIETLELRRLWLLQRRHLH
jgi:hypothetical protein